MKKRLVSTILAATMIIGATMTVNAASIADSEAAAAGQEITGSSTMNLPTIEITVPTTADIVINPYQMEYDLDGNKYTAQIISAEQEISSTSNVAVAVNVAELTTTNVSEGITIATAALTAKTTDKSALLYLEVVGGDATFETGYNKSSANQVIIPNYVEGGKVSKAAKDAIVVLDKVADGGDASVAKFKIGGNVVANPVVKNEAGEEVASPWTDADTIGVSFKFTFTPQVETTTTTE